MAFHDASIQLAQSVRPPILGGIYVGAVDLVPVVCRHVL